MHAENLVCVRQPQSRTNVTRFCSIFSQLLQLFPRVEFQKAVVATQAERHARGFTYWGQFVAMLEARPESGRPSDIRGSR
jgi:hypothetical protein